MAVRLKRGNAQAMSAQAKVELAFAISVTLLVILGMALIGWQTSPEGEGVIAPLVSVSEHSTPVQPGMELNRATPPSRIAVPATAVTMTQPMTGATQVAMIASPTAATSSLKRPQANTPTPIRVVVSTQKSSWVYYHGPSTPVRTDAFAPLAFSNFPRPTNDTGRGLHWFPTTYQTRAVVTGSFPNSKPCRFAGSSSCKG